MWVPSWQHLFTAAAAGAVVCIGAPIAIGAAGFSAGGVVAGSFAAGWQASIGNVAAGSLFALLQSVGVVGLSSSMLALLFTTAAGLYLLLCYLFHYFEPFRKLSAKQQYAVCQTLAVVYKHNSEAILKQPMELLKNDTTVEEAVAKLKEECGVKEEFFWELIQFLRKEPVDNQTLIEVSE